MKSLLLIIAIVALVGCSDPAKEVIKVRVGNSNNTESWVTVGDQDWIKDEMGRWCYKENDSNEKEDPIEAEFARLGWTEKLPSPFPKYGYPVEKEGVEAVEAYMKSRAN